jgi:hypothetical protein
MVAAEGEFTLSLFVIYRLRERVDFLDSTQNQDEIRAGYLESIRVG